MIQYTMHIVYIELRRYSKTSIGIGSRSFFFLHLIDARRQDASSYTGDLNRLTRPSASPTLVMLRVYYVINYYNGAYT